MPPTRTIPVVKPIKTERTHEENQERAYIAASRRSDRSLEARVESARRASEIHKRRTGRSLRVTEQDVINEEMYEEEDDDLPLQYRRLTAHLQTGSTDFNRRLAAYLTNQVAMRSAMEQMVHDSHPQQYNAMAQYQNYQNMFQSPMLPQHQAISQPPAVSSLRSAPYPSPHTPHFRQTHARANSTVVYPTTDPRSPGSQSTDHRRMSASVVGPQPPKSMLEINTDGLSPGSEYLRQTQSATMPQHQFPPAWQDMSPFTMSLPPESQQMLAPALDSNDPFQAMLMSGSENINSNPYFPWLGAHRGMKTMTTYPPAFPSMTTTMSPTALDSSVDRNFNNQSISPPTMLQENATPSSGVDFTFAQDSKLSTTNGPSPSSMLRQSSSQELVSGQPTPGDSFWDNFVEDGGWTAEAEE